jgi:Cu-processing system permease protein
MVVRQLVALTVGNLRMIVRDRILHGIFAVALVMLVLVPPLSSFSMRQTQEVAVTLSLSALSLALLVLTLLLGTSSLWRDIERRYTASVLTLPVSRTVYLLAKFCAIGVTLLVCSVILAAAAAVVIPLTAAQYPSDLPIAWGNILLSVAADVLKYLLLAGVAILISTVSTSFFLPFFGTLAIYLAGSASQEVFEYVSGQFGKEIPALYLGGIKAVYYLLPNFAAFDFKVHAVYALPVTAASLLFPLVYVLTYTGLLLGLAVWLFNRRELT